MEVKNVQWVGIGIGIGTDAYDATVDLFGRVLGMTRRFDEPDTVEFQTSEGDAVQVMGPGHQYFAFFGKHTAGPVPLFEVDDLDEAQRRLEAADIEIVGTVDRDSQWQWLSFRGPDRNLYQLGARLSDR